MPLIKNISSFIKKHNIKSNSASDTLTAQGILGFLSANTPKLDINIIPSATSTNTLVRNKINSAAPEGYLLIANRQISGKGRMGRSFFSPKDTGIYMSLLLKPGNCSPEKATKITTVAAVAVCEAIEIVSNKKVGIKWVNDVFADNKKVCGILTEGSVNPRNGLLEYAVLGVGINLYKPKNGFPSDLKQIAGYILDIQSQNTKNRLVAEFLNRFFLYYKQSLTSDSSDYIDEYKKRSIVIGKEVTFVSENSPKTATVVDIDNRCRLKVKYKNGDEEVFSSGEISVKLPAGEI